jgi:hypothetical protein
MQLILLFFIFSLIYNKIIILMKIPLDFILKVINKFLQEVDLKDVSKVLEKHINEDSDEEEDNMVGFLNDLDIKKLVKFYFSNNPEIKKAWKGKSSEKIRKFSQSEEYGRKEKNGKSNGELLKKKKERKVEPEPESEEEVIEPKVKHVAAKNDDKTPFRRIDNSLRTNLRDDLKDNSYANFSAKTGDVFAKPADDKLKIVKGKDFKKEKTKFKNKTTFGGQGISTEIRSIPLCNSDSD